MVIIVGCGRTGRPIPPGHALLEAPGDLTISTRGDTLTLVWSAPTKTVKGKSTAPLTGYLVERLVIPSDSADSQCPTCPEEGQPVETILFEERKGLNQPVENWTEDGLKEGWSYRFRVRGLDHRERSGTPSDQAEILWRRVEKPEVSIQAIHLGALIEFKPPRTPEGTKPRGLAVYNRDGTLALQLPPQTGTGEITNLPNDVPATFICRWVVATDTGWLLESDPVELQVVPRDMLPPKPPDELIAFGQPGSVRLNWLSVRGEPYETVIIERREAGAWVEKVRLGGNEVSYIDESATPGVLYGYRVRAVDGSGNVSKPSPVTEVKALKE